MCCEDLFELCRLYLYVGKSIILCMKPSVDLLLIEINKKQTNKKQQQYFRKVVSPLNNTTRGFFGLFFLGGG